MTSAMTCTLSDTKGEMQEKYLPWGKKNSMAKLWGGSLEIMMLNLRPEKWASKQRQ